MSSNNDIWERLLKSAKNQNILGIIGAGVGIIGLALALSQYIRAQPPAPTPQEPIQEQPPTTPVEEPIQPPTPTPTPTAPLSATLSVDKTSITVGQSVTFTIRVSGGVPPYTAELFDQYATFWRSPSGFAESTTATIKVGYPGEFRVVARVKDSRGNTVNSNTIIVKATQSTTPTPTPTPTTPLSAQLRMDKTTAVVGEPIRWYVTITGGVGPYTVKLVNSNTKEIYATMKVQ